MSSRSRRGVRSLLVAVGMTVLTLVTTDAGHAAVGDTLKTVTLPVTTNCASEGTDYGTALAVVPGGKMGFQSIPTLLATSCITFVPTGEIGTTMVSKIFFVDPSTNPATLKTSVTTSVTTRWDALFFRADTADLLACHDSGEGVSIYRIHVSPYDTVSTQGTATFLRSGPSGSTCDGVAWDPATKLVYQTTANFNTTAGSFNVVSYAPAPTAAATSIPSGCGNFFLGGIGIAGASLFVSCTTQSPPILTRAPAGVVSDLDLVPAALQTPATASIRQLDKTNGTLVRTVTNAALPGVPGGLPDDPISFGGQFKDALWTRDVAVEAVGDTLLALEIPGGTLGQSAGPPLLFPAACDQTTGATPDADGDGLLDCWETGSFWSDGRPGLSLDGVYSTGRNVSFRAVMLCVDQNANNVFDANDCASPTKKDIFVEIDYMQFHAPNATAVVNMIAAFAAAPVSNPNGTTGINLHLQIDQQLAHADRIALPPCTPQPVGTDLNFDTVKAANFGILGERGNAAKLNAKRNAYRYMLIAHNQTGSSASGCAEIVGNDSLVTLGSFTGASVAGHTGGVGTADQQAGTFMHEQGHNLGLRHGGGDNTNCKPHYPSVMSYSRQFSSPLNPRPLDYSRVLLGGPITTPDGPATGLDEAALLEPAGVGAFTGSIVYGPPAQVPFQGLKPVVASVNNTPVNWNNSASGSIDQQAIARDINFTGVAGCPTSANEKLAGFNDWANIKFNFRASMDFSDGAHASIDSSKAPDASNANNAPAGSLEITPEEADAIAYDTDQDGVSDALDNCPFTSNATQADANGNGVGDACEVVISVLRPSIPSTNQGVVHIAIFSRDGFDATAIDRATIGITGSSVVGFAADGSPNSPSGVWSLGATSLSGCTARDANGDKRIDLVCQFRIDARQLPIGVSEVVLEARTVPAPVPPSNELVSAAVRGSDTLDVTDVGAGQ